MELCQFIKTAQKYGLEIYSPKRSSDCYEILYQDHSIIGYRIKGGVRSHNDLFDYAILYNCSTMGCEEYYNGKIIYEIDEVETFIKWFIQRTKQINYQKSLNSINEDFK